MEMLTELARIALTGAGATAVMDAAASGALAQRKQPTRADPSSKR